MTWGSREKSTCTVWLCRLGVYSCTCESINMIFIIPWSFIIPEQSSNFPNFWNDGNKDYFCNCSVLTSTCRHSFSLTNLLGFVWHELFCNVCTSVCVYTNYGVFGCNIMSIIIVHNLAAWKHTAAQLPRIYPPVFVALAFPQLQLLKIVLVLIKKYTNTVCCRSFKWNVKLFF